MKAFSLSLLRWLSVVGCATAQSAYFYNFDVHPQGASSSISSSIDSETANAILTRRLAATESTKLGRVDDALLENLNRYGGQKPLSLFADQDQQQASIRNRLVIAIEGYDGEFVPASPSVTIERATTDLASTPFIQDLVCKKEPGRARCKTYLPLWNGMHFTQIIDAKKGTYIAKDQLVRMLGGNDDGLFEGKLKDILIDNLTIGGTKTSKTFLKLDLTRMTTLSREARNTLIKDVFTAFSDTLQELTETDRIESTLLLLPSQRAPPTLNLNINRRQTPLDEGEEPLSQPFVSISTPPSDSSSAISASNSTHPLPPLGSFLPTCFPNAESCNSATNNCSGHGTCSNSSSTCFACRCGSTIVRQDSDGKNVKTIQWGGAACEKKDVSMPFFLFAGFGVFMTAVVVGSVGLLWGMGSEELPGVIGAGVNGPRAQRQ